MKPGTDDNNMDEKDRLEDADHRPLWPQLWLTFVSCQVCVNIGVTIALGSVILTQEHDTIAESDDTGQNVSMTDGQRAWVVSILPLASMAANVLAAFLQPRLGGRRLMLLSGIASTLVWAGHMTDTLTRSVTALVVLRATSCAAAAIASAASQLYMAEMTSSERRGRLAVATDISIKLGCLLTFLLGAILPWRQAALVSGMIPSLILTLGCALTLPDSPFWLQQRQQHAEALRSARFLLPTADSVSQITGKSNCSSSDDSSNMSVKQAVTTILTRQRYRYPLLLLTAQFTLFTLSGALVVNSHLLEHLRATLPAAAAGGQYLTAAIVQLVALTTNCVCACMQDRSGRRALLVASGVIMAACLVALATLTSLESCAPLSSTSHSVAAARNNSRRNNWATAPIEQLLHINETEADTNTFTRVVNSTDIAVSNIELTRLTAVFSQNRRVNRPLTLISATVNITGHEEMDMPTKQLHAGIINRDTCQWFRLLLLVGWQSAFALNSPVTWTLLGELPPPPSTTRAVTANCVLVYWSTIYFALLHSYPAIIDTIGTVSVLLLFAGVCVLQALFARYMLPETRALHLTQIHSEKAVLSTEMQRFTSRNN